jgi:uncharacterized repeat protein (TIGR01451 family)
VTADAHEHQPTPHRRSGPALGVTALTAWLTRGAVAALLLAAAGPVPVATTARPVPLVAVARPVPAAGFAAAPQLSISVVGDRESAAAGDRIGYTVTVRNLGSDDVAGLHLTQTVPPGLVLGSTEPSAAVEVGAVRWIVDLTASADVTVRTAMTVGTTGPEQLRLASVACVAVTADGPPVVCAAHSAQLPTGAAAAVTTPAAEPARRRWPPSTTVVAVAALLAATALVVGVAGLLFRRRPARASTRP